jgi:hypothetical protein
MVNDLLIPQDLDSVSKPVIPDSRSPILLIGGRVGCGSVRKGWCCIGFGKANYSFMQILKACR